MTENLRLKINYFETNMLSFEVFLFTTNKRSNDITEVQNMSTAFFCGYKNVIVTRCSSI